MGVRRARCTFKTGRISNIVDGTFAYCFNADAPFVGEAH
jgi:hypothetical protein